MLPPSVYPHHSIRSTASFVSILKAAALSDVNNPASSSSSSLPPSDNSGNSEQEHVDQDDSEERDEDLDDEEDDDDDESVQNDVVDITSGQQTPPFASFRGYPSPKVLQGLACELLDQHSVRPRIISSTFTPRPSRQISVYDCSTPLSSPSLPVRSNFQPQPSSPTPNITHPQSNPPIEDSDHDVTSEERLHRLQTQFGVWSHKTPDGQLESEKWIAQVPGVLYRSVLVNGLIILTNRRLCYLAYLPTLDKGQIIRNGSVTLKTGTRFSKRRRRWVELRTDSITEYRSSTALFRPHSSYHFSEIQRILPLSAEQPRTLSLRLLDDRLVAIEFDTSEAADIWHQDFVRALFSFKIDYSNQMRMMLPLRLIKSVHRETFENIWKMMLFEVDYAPSFCSISRDIVEHDTNPSSCDSPRIELSYYLKHDPFDDAIIDAIHRAKMETPSSSSNDDLPAPLLELLDHSPAEDEAEAENVTTEKPDSTNSTNSKLATRFIKAFGLGASEKLTIYSCALLRTLPTSGHMVLSKDYFCFWRRGTVITQDYKLRIPIKDIGQVKQATAFGFTRFGIAIELAGAPDIRLDFSSKSMREEVTKALEEHSHAAKAEEKRINRRISNLPIPKPLGQNTEQFNLRSPTFMKQGCVLMDQQQSEIPAKTLNIVCLAIGSRGDVQPYISLAKRLMQDGHAVTIASHPEYRPWVESFGILYKDVGGDPAALMKLSVEHPFFSAGFFKEGLGHFRTWLDDLFMESWLACRDSNAELLIESPSTFAGIHIAEALRIPYFRAFTMTWTSTSTYPQAFASSIDLGPSYNLLSYSLFDNLIWRAMSGQVNRWRKRTLNLPATSMEKMQPYKVPFLYNFSSVVVPKPLDWKDHIDVAGYWFLDQSHGNYTPPEDLIEFIASARKDQVPLIYVGFGSVTVPDSTAVTKAIYAAVVQSGVRAIVAKGWSDRGNNCKNPADDTPVVVPSQVYCVQSIPHDWLFPQLDAVCHHGGAGTTGISLRYGIPTLIHPFFGDQPFWADRVTKLGAGLRVDYLTAQSLASAFIKATSDRIMKEKASQVGEKIRAEDGPSRAVDFIYRYLDFARERTEHRIARTQHKRRWVPSTSAFVPTLGEGSSLERESPRWKKVLDTSQSSNQIVEEVTESLSDHHNSSMSDASDEPPSPVSPTSIEHDHYPHGINSNGSGGRLHNPVHRRKSLTGAVSRTYSNLVKIPNTVSPGRNWSKLKKLFLQTKVIQSVG